VRAEQAVDRTALRQREIEQVAQQVQAEMLFWLAQLRPDALMESWLRDVLPGLFVALVTGQRRAAAGASRFIADAAEMMDLDPATQYRVAPEAFGGSAADGRPLTTMLTTPALRARRAVELRGQDPVWAAGQVRQSVLLMGASETADAGRGANQAAMTATRSVTGYIRVVRPGACQRCAILAGRWYRYNADFDRHKRCQCAGVPAGSRASSRIPGWRTDPGAYFRQLSHADQNRLFGVGGATAIREGADINSVVNARRAAASLRQVEIGGRRIELTTEGTTRRGNFSGLRRRLEAIEGRSLSRLRMTPQAIFETAADREELIRLLGRHGYLVKTAAQIAAL
jgi:hypothetical protein